MERTKKLIQHFTKKLPRTDTYVSVDGMDLERYTDKLPERLLRIWDIEGFRAYGEGVVWTVNPEEYSDTIKIYLQDTPFETIDTFHTVFVGAFGGIRAIGENIGSFITLSVPYNAIIAQKNNFLKRRDEAGKDRVIQSVFAMANKGRFDIPDLKTNQSLFDQAYERFGMLGADEVYAFKKRLCDGGIATISNIQVENIFDYIKEIRQSCGVPQVPFSDIKVDIDKMTVSRG